MIVSYDQGRGIVEQSETQNFARVDHALAQAAPKQMLGRQASPIEPKGNADKALTRLFMKRFTKVSMQLLCIRQTQAHRRWYDHHNMQKEIKRCMPRWYQNRAEPPSSVYDKPQIKGSTMNPQDKNDKTDFGFENVSPEEKTERVRGVFASVAAKYDIMNDVMSAGLHRLWKRRAVQCSGVRQGQTVLDIAGGTGDLSLLYSERVGPNGQVILADINANMLQEGRAKVLNRGNCHIQFVQANAEILPFADNSFDCVNIAFGLRNVTDKAKALRSMCRVLKPGGKLIVLEFSKPTHKWMETVYDQYSFHLIPKFGKLITGDEASYRYLVESIRKHPDQETLKNMITDAGFEQAAYENLQSGIVAIHSGVKPE